MTKIFTVFIFCSIFCSPVFSQEKIANSIKVDRLFDMDGKIIQGRIKGGESRIHYDVLEFFHHGGNRKVYAPGEVLGFELGNGRYYKSILLPGVKDKVFAQVVLSGKLSLLTYLGEFYIKSGEKILKLDTEKVEVNVHGDQRVFIKKFYLQVLSASMGNACSGQLAQRIQKTQLKLNSLLTLFEAYHQCAGLEFKKHVAEFSSFDISWGILVGGSGDKWSSVSLSTDRSGASGPGKISSINDRVYPHVLLLARMRNPMKSTRLFFDAGIGYIHEENAYSSKFESDNEVELGTDHYRSHTVYLPISLGFAPYQREAVSVYAGSGVNLNMSGFSSSYDSGRNLSYQGEKPMEFISPVLMKKKVGLSVFFKMGAEGKISRSTKWIVEAQLSRSAKGIYYSRYDIYNQLMYSLLAGVRF